MNLDDQQQTFAFVHFCNQHSWLIVKKSAFPLPLFLLVVTNDSNMICTRKCLATIIYSFFLYWTGKGLSISKHWRQSPAKALWSLVMEIGKWLRFYEILWSSWILQMKFSPNIDLQRTVNAIFLGGLTYRAGRVFSPATWLLCPHLSTTMGYGVSTPLLVVKIKGYADLDMGCESKLQIYTQ